MVVQDGWENRCIVGPVVRWYFNYKREYESHHVRLVVGSSNQINE